MNKGRRYLWFMPIAAGVLFLFLFSIGWPPGEDTYYSPQEAVVSFVIDGDTVELSTGERVRYIGINAPEIGRVPGQGPECYGPEALARNRELVNGRRVTLIREETDTDRYGRLLRHVYVDDVWVGQTLVAEGYARSVYIRPDVREYDELRAAQDAARDSGAGLWSACQ